ncbi:hypothetical protein PENTCL1PPCAC_8861, partial [Pristionchus entomophagus]
KHDITLIGQSAGAASVDMLHLSPHSIHRFHKVILMAGSADCRWATNKNMPQQCRNKAARLGITEYANSEEMLEQLRALPATDFGVALHNHVMEPDVDFETVSLLDGDFFPDSLEELRKRATPKPIIAGVTKEEGIL